MVCFGDPNEGKDVATCELCGEPMSVIEDIKSERAAQDRQWGGPQHDDEHEPIDWVHFIDKQLNDATRYAKLLRENTEEMAQEIYSDDFRVRLVKIAALAVAAIESADRRRPAAEASR